MPLFFRQKNQKKSKKSIFSILKKVTSKVDKTTAKNALVFSFNNFFLTFFRNFQKNFKKKSLNYVDFWAGDFCRNHKKSKKNFFQIFRNFGQKSQKIVISQNLTVNAPAGWNSVPLVLPNVPPKWLRKLLDQKKSLNYVDLWAGVFFFGPPHFRKVTFWELTTFPILRHNHAGELSTKVGVK